MSFRLIGLLTLTALATYTFMLLIKTDITNLEEERKALFSEQRQLRENLRVIKAELAYLSSPARLEKYLPRLKLAPINTEQLHSLPAEASR